MSEFVRLSRVPPYKCSWISLALVVLAAAGVIHTLAAVWWVIGMMPGSSGGGNSAPPPPPLWSPEEEAAMKASPVARADAIPLSMQEKPYEAAKAAASKVVDELSAEELLRARKKSGTNKAQTLAGAGPRQPGLVPKKPGLLIVSEDVEMVQSELATAACPK
ncbi:MAG: hypothetical protein ACKPKO_39845, partial [Candidatus Fonsibacter sp.]